MLDARAHRPRARRARLRRLPADRPRRRGEPPRPRAAGTAPPPAGFEQLCRLEDFDWSAQVRLDRRLLDAACSCASSTAASTSCSMPRRRRQELPRPGARLRSRPLRAQRPLRDRRPVLPRAAQARVDHSTEKAFRSFLAPDLLILDDLGLHRLSAQQSIDLYELIIGRHRSSSFVITSNRAVAASSTTRSSAAHRLANASYQIVRGRELPAALAAPRPARGAGRGRR